MPLGGCGQPCVEMLGIFCWHTSHFPVQGCSQLIAIPSASFRSQQPPQRCTRCAGILFVQLAITTGVAALMMMNQGINAYLSVNPWPLWTAMVVSFVTIIAMACKPELSRTYPTNYALLGVFTLAESVLIGMICMVRPKTPLCSPKNASIPGICSPRNSLPVLHAMS